MSLKSKLALRKPDQVDLVFCLDRQLAKELAQATVTAAQNAEGRMAAGKDQHVRELEKKAREASVTIRLFSLSWLEYNEVMLENPAREGFNEKFNSATFYIAVARKSAVEITSMGSEVPIPDEDWDEFISGLTDGEHDRLAAGVVQVNRNLTTVDVAPLG